MPARPAGTAGPSAARCHRLLMLGSLTERLRARPEWKFLAILPRANPLLAAIWWTVLVLRSLLPALFAVAMGLLVGAVEAGGRSGLAARRRRNRVRPPAGAPAAAPRRRRQPGELRGGLALRRADGVLRGAARHRAPGGPGARRRPDHGAGLRPRHQRAAPGDLDGLHRGRTGRAAGRADRRGHPVRLRLVGAAAARRRLARDALAAARERGLEGPADRRGARGAAARRLRVPAGGGRAGRQGGPAVRPRRLDHRPLPASPAPAPRPALGSDEAARTPGGGEPGRGAGSQRHRVLVAGRRRQRRRAAARPPGDVRRRRDRRQLHRLRRVVLGPRRRGGAPPPRCCGCARRWRRAAR